MIYEFIEILKLFNQEELNSPLPRKEFAKIEKELKMINLDKTKIQYCSPEYNGKKFSGFVRFDQDKTPQLIEFKSKIYGDCNIPVLGKDKNANFVINNIYIINEYLGR